jgi:hypothetical protein
MNRPGQVFQLCFAITCLCFRSHSQVQAFASLPETQSCFHHRTFPSTATTFSLNSKEWKSDFDDYLGDDGESKSSEDDERFQFSSLVAPQQSFDLSACQSRLFSLGVDLILTDFVGNMGFDQVTDWEYYYEDEDNPSDRKVVKPSPFDKSKPKRTRSSSGSVVSVNSVT